MTTKVPQAMLEGGTELLNIKGADIASAATVNLTTATGDLVDVTGTTTITAITLAEGEQRTVRFTGALTLTHGASLVLPGGANITTAAGDFAVFRGYAAGVVRCVVYTKASGVSVVAAEAGAITAAMLASSLDLSAKTLTLPANGSRAGEVVQVVNTQTGAYAAFTTAIPHDDSIPQNNEGGECMTLAITPTNASNKLKIEVVVNAAHSAINQWIMALFQDSGADALAACGVNTVSAGPSQGTLIHYMTAGSTSAITFKVRIGGNTGSTLYFNGSGAARKYGGVMASSITITEIKV